jgi:hypothetical protein
MPQDAREQSPQFVAAKRERPNLENVTSVSPHPDPLPEGEGKKQALAVRRQSD